MEGVEEVTGSREDKEDEEERRETGLNLVLRGTSVRESAIDSLGVIGFYSSFNMSSALFSY